jgi:hypothetical protein
VKELSVPGGRSRELPDMSGFASRLFKKRDVPEAVSAWRQAPQAALAALASEEKKAYIAALGPLIGGQRKFVQQNLRRLFQLFALMDMPDADRLELLTLIASGARPELEAVPVFRDRQVRHSLVEEAEVFAHNAPSKPASDYVALLRIRLNVKPGNVRKLTRLLEKLTDIENRAAALLGKQGHIVRLDDRQREIFKKSVAAVAVPSALLFPLGTVGLSAEGITTGLIALGGGFILPAGIALATGLGAVVALGITTKKLLDLMMPTIDADRVSIDLAELHHGMLAAQHLFDELADDAADPAALAQARERIAAIMQKIAPLTAAERARIEGALNHARLLGRRYVASLEHDRTTLAAQHHELAHELGRLLELDRPAMIAIAGC